MDALLLEIKEYRHMMTELSNESVPTLWRPANGFPDYSVSNSGQIRNKVGVTLAPQPCKRHGYVSVTLFANKKPTRLRLHIVIARTFVPNPESKPVVNHINGVKHDNRAANLEWVTQKENVARKVFPNPGRNRSRKVVQISPAGVHVRVWDSLTLAARGLGLTPQNITHACNRHGGQTTAGGWRWVYLEETETPTPDEEWKVLGHDGRTFGVSSTGRVRLESGAITEGSLRAGYRIVCGKYRIHRLVALAFHPNPDNRPFVNHIDGVSTNNAAANLEWVTPKENSQHAAKTGLKTSKNKYTRRVRQLTLEGVEIWVFGSMTEACRATSASPGNLTEVCRGRRGSAGGFRWEYVGENALEASVDDLRPAPANTETSGQVIDLGPLLDELGL